RSNTDLLRQARDLPFSKNACQTDPCREGKWLRTGEIMKRLGRATVKRLPAEARLENLSEWLTDGMLAVAGLCRVDKDTIAAAALPGERMLLLTLDLTTSPAPRRGSACILIESSERGAERLA